MSTSNLKIIDTLGGPLILMEIDNFPSWKGIEEETDFQISDYDRACEIEEYLGLLDVKEKKNSAVVLGGEPMPTAWIQLSENAGVIVRINFANSIEDIPQHLSLLTLDQFKNRNDIELRFEFGELLIFDAALDQDLMQDSIKITLQSGKFGIQTEFYEPNEEFSFLLHPMILIS